jgi:5-methylcytosine-specific restriction protein A
MIAIIKDKLKGKVKAGEERSPLWAGVRNKYLEENPKCAVCERTEKTNVHHIKPFHLHPELELVPSNLMTLCENQKNGINCHLFVGHLGNFRNINPNSIQDAATWNVKLKEENFHRVENEDPIVEEEAAAAEEIAEEADATIKKPRKPRVKKVVK